MNTNEIMNMDYIGLRFSLIAQVHAIFDGVFRKELNHGHRNKEFIP